MGQSEWQGWWSAWTLVPSPAPPTQVVSSGNATHYLCARFITSVGVPLGIGTHIQTELPLYSALPDVATFTVSGEGQLPLWVQGDAGTFLAPMTFCCIRNFYPFWSEVVWEITQFYLVGTDVIGSVYVIFFWTVVSQLPVQPAPTASSLPSHGRGHLHDRCSS